MLKEIEDRKLYYDDETHQFKIVLNKDPNQVLTIDANYTVRNITPNNINPDGTINPMEFFREEKTPTKNPDGTINPMEFFKNKEIKKKNHEEKLFIILYKLKDTSEDDLPEEFTRIYSVCIGRTAAYRDIQSKLVNNNIDIINSIVITESLPKDENNNEVSNKYYLLNLSDCYNIYKFCKAVEDQYTNSDFRIDSYLDKDIELENFKMEDVISNTSEVNGSINETNEEIQRMIEENKERQLFLEILRRNTNSQNL